MPIVNVRESGNLAPVEEEPEAIAGAVMERSCKANEARSGVSLFTSLGTLLLTSRPYESSTETPLSCDTCCDGSEVDKHGTTLQGEIFQTVSKKSLLTMQDQMERLWRERIPMCIEVKGQSAYSYDSVLLEQWLIQVLPRRSHIPPIPPSFLAHAVQSFLQFSQIRSWIVSHSGSLPFELTYRVCAPGEDTSDQFSPHTPRLHTFPPSPLSPLSSIQVSVHHLPRLTTIPHLLNTSSDITAKFRNLSLSKSVEHVKDVSLLKSTQRLIQDPSLYSKSAECLKAVAVSSSVEKMKKKSLSKSAERFRDLSTCPASRLVTPPHLIRHPSLPHSPHTPSPHSPHTPHSSSSSHTAHQPHTLQETFPFSPPQPSPMSPKLLAGLGEPLRYHSLLDRALIDESSSEDASVLRRGETVLDGSSCSKCSYQNRDGRSYGSTVSGHSCAGPFCFDSGCVREGGGRGRWREGDGEAVREKRKKGGRCGAVRSPAASSPVPFMRRCMSETKRSNSSAVRRSSTINIKGVYPIRPLRSNSLPAAMPSLSLLGTFEESVLNGRLEPCGFVEGFTAELGASGSFCPRHITLPVTAAFFNLSDCGTSPYLGVIDLSTTGKRGYHIPKKGTVQLTLFNPNGTVIKIFVVTYDFSDMPPNTQTFLRQKIISHTSPSSRPHIITPRTLSPPLLHYLIHLRFLCSKSGRVYLHKDIRLIFACRAPDTEPDSSRVTIVTVMEAPPSPKYGPLDGPSDTSK